MKIYHVGKSNFDYIEAARYLHDIGVEKIAFPNETSSGEKIVEMAGRLCYRSFQVGLNKNVTKIREDSGEYVANILRQHHGRVLEHCVDSFVCTGVSRVLTHELLTHKVGVSISQESMRFVRVEELDLYEPKAFEGVGEEKEIKVQWDFTVSYITDKVKRLFRLADLESADFSLKKRLTSAIRRLIPMGQKTSVMITANARAWRWMIEARTSVHAEEEIRELFLLIWRDLKKTHPLLFVDSHELIDGTVEFENSKV